MFPEILFLNIITIFMNLPNPTANYTSTIMLITFYLGKDKLLYIP